MSNLELAPREALCAGPDTDPAPTQELLIGRDVVLGGTRGLRVTRTLPHKVRRMVGAWCFVDHFGELASRRTQPSSEALDKDSTGMRVAPHPHLALQTVTWLFAGEIHHRDSLGSSQVIRPGQLNLMTAGRGIAHSEESPRGRSPVLHGVQLWVALPDRDRHTEPRFEHHAELPVLDRAGVRASVLVGTLDTVRSPATTYSPIVGAELALAGSATLPLRPEFEHAVLAVSGAVEVDGTAVEPGAMLYLGVGRAELAVSGDGRALLLGGEPFAEEIIMWWNFIARTHEEIVRARADWQAGRTFGEVRGYDGPRLPAPPMPETALKPRGRTR
jgi:redox-sensitive bicupin YhaK (pirin superfamily)